MPQLDELMNVLVKAVKQTILDDANPVRELLLSDDYHFLIVANMDLLTQELKDVISACFPTEKPATPYCIPTVILVDPRAGWPVLVHCLPREHVDPIRYVNALGRLGIVTDLEEVLAGPDKALLAITREDADRGLRALEHALGNSVAVSEEQFIDEYGRQVFDDDDQEPDVNPLGCGQCEGCKAQQRRAELTDRPTHKGYPSQAG